MENEPMRLTHIDFSVPENRQNISDFSDRFSGFDLAMERSGVLQKGVALPDETALDLAIATMRQLHIQQGLELSTIDGLVFITQTQDLQLPGNAFLLLQRLGMTHDVLTYDVNQGCAGFNYGLHLAQSILVANQATRVCVICSDTYSKLLAPDDRGTNLLFGDGCAAAIVDLGDVGTKIEKTKVRQLSQHAGLFVAEGSNAREDFNGERPYLKMDGAGLLMVLTSQAPDFLNSFLAQVKRSASDIDLFICHQASKVALDRVQDLMGLPDDKMFRNLEMHGNTTSASLPIALAEALENPKYAGAKNILCFGFGVGFSMSASWMCRD
jgi:3-oxoacyl-[acyl-carrier-protein] synthase-3